MIKVAKAVQRHSLATTTCLVVLVLLSLAAIQKPSSSSLLVASWSLSAVPPRAAGFFANGLLFKEDFTDGAFDDSLAGPNGANWRMTTGQGVGWYAPNARPFPLSLARKPSLGTEGWAGATWAIWNDANANGGYNDGEMQDFGIDKKDEVAVLKFESFSDMARKPETYGVEVAMMEWSDSLAGNPHYWHDLSFEAVQMMHVDRSQVPTQLTGNVENIENRQPTGVKFAHFNANAGYPTQVEMSQTYKSQVVWRNRFGSGTTNVESKGQLNRADYSVGSEMNNMLDRANPRSIFDHVQITFFRSPIVTSNPFLIRNGVTSADAQVGILNCEVGITKKCDFNLDYKIDQQDKDILIRNLGTADTSYLELGDANNNNQTDIEDANSLVAFWPTDRPLTAIASATYNPTTGRINLSCEGIAYFHISSLSGSLLPQNLSQPAQLEAFGKTDSLLGGFAIPNLSLTMHDLGTIAATNLPAGDLFLTINYCGSGVSQGFTIPLETQTFTSATSIKAKLLVQVGLQSFTLPATKGTLTAEITSLDGKRMWKSTHHSRSSSAATWQIPKPNQAAMLRITDDQRRVNFVRLLPK